MAGKSYLQIWLRYVRQAPSYPKVAGRSYQGLEKQAVAETERHRNYICIGDQETDNEMLNDFRMGKRINLSGRI